MPGRSKPADVANRELERLARKESRLMAELQEIEIERERWTTVMRAVTENRNGIPDDDDGVAAE